MKNNRYLVTFFVTLCTCLLPTISKAQFNENGLVIRSGINFQYSPQDSPYTLPDNIGHESENFTYYFTPGIGKFIGNGFYIGLEGRIGSSSRSMTAMVNGDVTHHSKYQNLIYGGGVLLRKYFNVSDRFTPFVGLSNTFFKEKGDEKSPNGFRSYHYNNFTADIQLGAQYRISPRIGIEAYFTPGGLLVSKDKNASHKADISPNFGESGQHFSFVINYFLGGK